MAATRLNPEPPAVSFTAPCWELRVFVAPPLGGGDGFAIQATRDDRDLSYIAEFTAGGYRLWKSAGPGGWQLVRSV